MSEILLLRGPHHGKRVTLPNDVQQYIALADDMIPYKVEGAIDGRRVAFPNGFTQDQRAEALARWRAQKDTD